MVSICPVISCHGYIQCGPWYVDCFGHLLAGIVPSSQRHFGNCRGPLPSAASSLEVPPHSPGGNPADHPALQGSPVQEKSPASFPPEVLERGRLIACGSYGEVWAVRNTATGEKAAMKSMSRVFYSRIDCIRALREMRIMHEFHHDNVLSSMGILPPTLPLLDSDISIVSELMDSSLLNVIMSSQELSEDYITLFMYQILRGVKYLHSADIMHRDLKPGNILVNSNFQIKICDFGLAREVVPISDQQIRMKVVGSRFYYSPELLAGCIHYGVEIDMWSVGCIFAALLGQNILFEGDDPSSRSQLELITDLLGTPAAEDVGHIEPPSARSSLLSANKPSTLHQLYGLWPNTTHEAVHLLGRLLQFNPKKRLTAAEALCHPYLNGGRQRYHTHFCTCCKDADEEMRIYCKDLEPCSAKKFDSDFEKNMTSLKDAHTTLVNYIFSSQ